MRFLLYFFLLIIPTTFFPQGITYSVAGIPSQLKENAHAVIRSKQTDIDIISQRSMVIKQKTIITVLNEDGLSDLDTYGYYDKNTRIKKISATVYNNFGQEIKLIKKKDFKDRSVGDGFSVFNDNRMLYYDYTPVNYPFTIVCESEIETSNTAFIPNWNPIADYYISTEEAILNISYPAFLGFDKKEANFSEKFDIEKIETNGKISYKAKNITALKKEEGSPEFSKIVPIVYSKVEKFNLEGIDGQAKTWKDFGKWYYDNLLSDTEQLTVETQNKIKQLVGDEKDALKIAKIVYKYVQDKTRYVSIQVGIGGFKPMPAKDVDRLGYGDCKALTNYTRALLNTVGISSYYTILYGGNNKKNMHEDFVSVQGNHVILALPYNNELVWLECTSQIQPFGLQGDFTDDRNVVIVNNEGGQLVKTKAYLEQDNRQEIKGKYSISDSGFLTGNLSISSYGSQYDNTFGYERYSAIQRDNHYKNHFRNISNLKLHKLDFKNDVEQLIFTQDISLSASGYASLLNDKLMFVLNVFNFNSHIPKKYRKRENPFEVNRGFFDEDEVIVDIPEGYEIEVLPSNAAIKSKYGEYETTIERKDGSIVYKRTLLIKKGMYDSKDYEEYRLFREQIARYDNAKIILNKKI